MADSWQQIDDDGVVMDWMDLDMPDLWHPLNALRRAINERQYALRLSQTPAIDRLYCIADAKVLLHDAISKLIINFIDHRDNNADWDKKYSIPKWTEETILDAIGDGERVNPAKLYDIKPWMRQAYKILNMMRLPYIYRSLTLDPNALVKGRTNSPTAELALAQWATLNWWNASVLVGHYFVGENYGWGNNFAIARHSNTYSEKNNYANTLDIEAYSSFDKVRSEGPYENNDFPGYAEGMLKRVISAESVPSGVTVDSGLLGYDGRCNLSTPAAGEYRGWYLDPNAVIVYRWDGPNGFKFRDWE